jgi:phosphoribosylanthranilate isomerase
MWIKVCANTNVEDARLAAELGADAVGFVFGPSARRVTAAQVAEITRHLPANVERVGVFPALTAEVIAQMVDEAGLSAVQLHGGVDLALLREVRQIVDRKIKVIQTVHWNVETEGTEADEFARHLREIAAEGLVDRVLIDSKTASASGGTGRTFDWGAARAVLAESAEGFDVIVAGGLRAENVAEAIHRLQPWGVDVASGVEELPGRKSREKLEAFVRAAREA